VPSFCVFLHRKIQLEVVYNATELDFPKSQVLQRISGRFVVYNATELNLGKSHVLQGVSGRCHPQPYSVGFSKVPRFTRAFLDLLQGLVFQTGTENVE
jgi:hypothetical protein